MGSNFKGNKDNLLIKFCQMRCKRSLITTYFLMRCRFTISIKSNKII